MYSRVDLKIPELGSQVTLLSAGMNGIQVSAKNRRSRARSVIPAHLYQSVMRSFGTISGEMILMTVQVKTLRLGFILY